MKINKKEVIQCCAFLCILGMCGGGAYGIGYATALGIFNSVSKEAEGYKKKAHSSDNLVTQCDDPSIANSWYCNESLSTVGADPATDTIHASITCAVNGTMNTQNVTTETFKQECKNYANMLENDEFEANGIGYGLSSLAALIMFCVLMYNVMPFLNKRFKSPDIEDNNTPETPAVKAEEPSTQKSDPAGEHTGAVHNRSGSQDNYQTI